MKDTSPGRFRRHRWPSSGRRFCLPPSGMCWILQSALPLRGFWFRETIYSLLWKGSNLTFRLHLVCPSLPFAVLLYFFICRNSFLRAIYLYKYCNRTAGSRTSDHCIHCCIFYSESHYSDYQHRSIHHHQCLSWLCFFSCTDQLFRVFLSDAPDRNLYYDSTCHCRILYYLSDFAKKSEFDLKEGIEAHPPGCRSIPFTDLFSI